MKTKYIVKGIMFGLLCIAAFLGFGWITMHLWNWLLPSIFTSIRAITFCEAIGLIILSRILFGGFRGGWKGRCGGGHCHGHHGSWKSRWENKWSQMTPEEKEKFKKGFGRKCWGEGAEEKK
ncbi:MAG: hypothetical protein ACHQRM_01245 [Bacteroidia bacterium]